MGSKMFPFITCTWNPLGGKCQHACTYCWAQKLAKKFAMRKYIGPAHLSRKELNKVFDKDDFVFVCDMCDLFGDWVPSWMIQRILDRIAMTHATFLLLTKNPKRYQEFLLPLNCVAGATIETDQENSGIAIKTPLLTDRIAVMIELKHPRKMISIEPIMEFNHIAFAEDIERIKPEFVAVGYDNYGNGLPEPSLEKTLAFIEHLEYCGIKVYRKSLREAWNANNFSA